MGRRGKYELVLDRSGRWRWRLVAANGCIVCQSEAYTYAKDARRGIDAHRRAATEAYDQHRYQVREPRR
jgi:uncharacterized protein YegP (UPF0339 family)